MGDLQFGSIFNRDNLRIWTNKGRQRIEQRRLAGGGRADDKDIEIHLNRQPEVGGDHVVHTAKLDQI